LLGSGRSNLDAILANVIDPNQIIGNGYEAINVTTKDNRTLSGRMVEDTPSHVKLLSIGGAEQIVPRDQIAKLENTHQSTMPMGFGALPDDVFRNLIWYVLAPPEEGPLTKEKKAALSASIDAAPAKKSSGPNTRAIDWESISLWNPEWKVNAPDFERTPVNNADFHGRGNVLLMHPFTKDKPCSLERTMKLAPGKPHKLSVTVAAHDQGDWELRVKVNAQEVKKSTVGHDGERWKTITVDLSEYAGKEVALRVEGAANGWSNEFGYWGEVKVE
jgi:putative heme-binding domain-containing protein